MKIEEITLYRKSLSQEYAIRPGITRDWIAERWVSKNELNKVRALLCFTYGFAIGAAAKNGDQAKALTDLNEVGKYIDEMRRENDPT